MNEPGTLFEGKYEVLEKLREGGMGAVYKVHHRLLDQVRVIKVLKADLVASDEMRHRFLAEAKTATKLKHPSIAALYDFDIDKSGRAYIVMEYIEGVNLKELLQEQGIPELALTLEVARQTLLALGYLHKRSYVHRDIAPDNLMLSRDEAGQPRVKLIDLGIAKHMDTGPGITAAGMFVGKLAYASPELFGALGAGEKLDGRSDLYSLGVVLYELLTGVRPFSGDASALMQAHLEGKLLPFESSDPGGRVPEGVRALLRKALARRRADRFPSADAMAAAIAELQRKAPPAAVDDKTIAFLAHHHRPAPEPPPVPKVAAAPPPETRHAGDTEIIHTPAPETPDRRLPRWALAAGLGVLTVVAFLAARKLLRPPADLQEPPVPTAIPTAAVAATPAEAAPTEPLPTPPEPTVEPSVVPTPEPTVELTPAPAVAPVETAAPRRTPRAVPTRARPRATPVRTAPFVPTPAQLPSSVEPTRAPAAPQPRAPTPAEDAAIRREVGQYARAFSALHAMRRELEIVSILVNGATAEARCVERAGRGSTGGAGPRPRTIRLERRGDSWKITSPGP